MFEILLIISSFITPSFGAHTTVSEKVSVETSSATGFEVIKMRVDSQKVACGDDSNKTCFRVQKEASIGMDFWEILQQPIEGFNFEEGYVYDLVVRIDIQEGKTGNDRFKYTLEHVVSKIKA